MDDSPDEVEILHKKYIVKGELAQGCHGSVKLAVSSSGSPVVVKKMKKKEVDSYYVTNEVRAGEVLNKQKGLVKFREYISDEENHFVVLDYIKGKDLLEFMEARNFKPLSEKAARKIAKPLIKAVKRCHTQGIAHKDLKLENVMLDKKGKTILIDFGFCEFSHWSEKSCKFVGTPDYAAPEIILKQPYSAYKADVYSAGVLIFCLLTGVLPFDLKRKCEILWSGRKPAVTWNDPCLPKLSEQAKDLLNKMLETDPEQRLSIEQVLNHKWMQKRSFF